ncbi:hypothetical protein AWP77_17925 [Escherichia coli]|nr:hypothetical protein AWP77_17925 [Escherichia coli]OKW54831.1 hypothetical protein AWP76_11170 [Escherichia coli]
MVRRLRFSGPKTSIICSPMTSLKTSIKTITYLSDIGCLEIQGASLVPCSRIRTLILGYSSLNLPIASGKK